MHSLIYRWPATRLSEETIERVLTQSGEALAAMAASLSRRLAERSKKSP